MISNELLINSDKLHTTELGAVRIKRNLSLDTDDVVTWCKAVFFPASLGLFAYLWYNEKNKKLRSR